MLKISNSNFYDCPNLEKVVVGKGLGVLSNAFVFCDKLKEIIFEGSIEEWNAVKKDTKHVIILESDIERKDNTNFIVIVNQEEKMKNKEQKFLILIDENENETKVPLKKTNKVTEKDFIRYAKERKLNLEELCSGIKRVIIPQGVKIIDKETLSFWKKIEVVALPKGLTSANPPQTTFGGNIGEQDELFVRALYYVVSTGVVSISKLQRKFGIGFPRAARLVDKMEELGYIGETKDNNQREILIDMPTLVSKYGDVSIE